MNHFKLLTAIGAVLILGTGTGLAGSHGNDLIHSRPYNGMIYMMYHNHMTLYIHDNDAIGVSNCTGPCAKKWPPTLLPADSKLGENYTLIRRKDGWMQAAFKGQPLYLWSGDKKIGDIRGDGLDGAWHLATPDS